MLLCDVKQGEKRGRKCHWQSWVMSWSGETPQSSGFVDGHLETKTDARLKQ